jgi:CheY-like chemotaxis protein
MAKEIRGRASVLRGAAVAWPTVLVVDADPALADVVAALLRAWGCTVAVAGTGAAAQTALDALWPSLVLVDLAVDGDGEAVVAALRERHRAARYVVVGPERALGEGGAAVIARDGLLAQQLAALVGR